MGGIRLRVAPTFTGPPPSLSNAGAVVALGSVPLRAVVVAGMGRAPSCASDDAAPPSPPCFFNRVLEGGERASPRGASSEVGGGRPDPTGGQVVGQPVVPAAHPTQVPAVWVLFARPTMAIRSALYNSLAKIEHSPADSNGSFTGKTRHSTNYGCVFRYIFEL